MRAKDRTDSQTVLETSQTLISLKLTDNEDYLRILHVDDDSCLLEVSKQILSMDNKFEIDAVLSVDEAFEKLEKQTYDAVVSDYEMPLKNGLDFLKELREQNGDIPFILFTGKGREDVVVKALNLGADSYINKNGSPETVYCELADAINKTVERKKSRKLLAASESKYRTLVEKSLQGILVTKVAPLRLVFANEAMGKILGYSPQDLLSLSPEGIMGLVYHEDRAVFFKRIENRLRGEPAEACFEFRAVQKDGSIIWLSALSNRVEYDGQPVVQGMFLDVTESKKTGEILRESEQRYRELANSLPDIVFETDINGQVLFANERATEISGYSQGELEKGLNVLQFIAPKDRERATKNIQRLFTGCSYVSAEYTFVRKDGTTFPALVTATPRISGNKMAGLRGLAIDITERKKTEESLEKEQQELKRIIDSSPIIIFYKDKEGKFVRVNETFAKALKIPKEKFLGKTAFDFYSAEIARGIAHDDLEVLQSGRSRLGIIEQYESESGMRWVQTDKFPILDKNGISTGLIGFALDITERKKAEEQLKESEEKYQTMFESSMDALMLLDEKNFLYCNTATLMLFGCASAEEFTKYHPADLSPPTQPNGTSSMEAAMSHINKAFKMGSDSFFWVHKRVDGATFPADVLLTRMSLKGRNVLQATVRDITELKKAEEAIKFQAELLNHVGQAVIMVDRNRTIRFWNKAAEKLYGWSEEQALGQKVNELLGGASPEEVAEVSKRLMAGESWSTEVLTKNRDGSVVPVILNRTPIYNGDGEFVGGASITTDITLQKNTEADLTFALNSLSNSLDKIQELNEKLRLVGGLTRHDVRNKLSAVTGYAYILKKKHGDQADIVDGLGKMEQAVDEIVRIFDFAKIYEQIGAEELTYINVEEKLNEAVALFSGPIPTIINECHGLTVLADSFLKQLFLNFIDNTRKYGVKTTTIRVYFEKADQDSLKLVYEDDGVGVPLENKPRLFSEGFSTGGSTGFGLFLTKKMMDVYGWKIEENGEPDKGAKFTISIPKIDRNGKENFQMQQMMTPKYAIEDTPCLIHDANTQQNFSCSCNCDVESKRMEKGGGDDSVN
jgi:PAS domain S-box-containing protein